MRPKAGDGVFGPLGPTGCEQIRGRNKRRARGRGLDGAAPGGYYPALIVVWGPSKRGQQSVARVIATRRSEMGVRRGIGPYVFLSCGVGDGRIRTNCPERALPVAGTPHRPCVSYQRPASYQQPASHHRLTSRSMQMRYRSRYAYQTLPVLAAPGVNSHQCNILSLAPVVPKCDSDTADTAGAIAYRQDLPPYFSPIATLA
ncbi:hypothetical protein BJX63DRAFT_114445 [Aspergillus granulosus]|uniref:Uncharacterized protein n=1 Tax=Aspergillus granulosus TaxID=176169 RepID=A0ABR4GTQ2_9EURO